MIESVLETVEIVEVTRDVRICRGAQSAPAVLFPATP